MKIMNSIRTYTIGAMMAIAPVVYSQVNKTPVSNHDTFEHSIPDTGTSDWSILSKAPNPSITIAGEKKKAVIVVDISTNVLFKYDKSGMPEKAYRIASGRKSMPMLTKAKPAPIPI